VPSADDDGAPRRSSYISASQPGDAEQHDPVLPDIPEWTRRYDDERRESTSVLRGLFFAFFLALPPAALLVGGIVWLVSLLS
jgi:hypothetical protein